MRIFLTVLKYALKAIVLCSARLVSRLCMKLMDVFRCCVSFLQK